jgi:hypothetical protein
MKTYISIIIVIFFLGNVSAQTPDTLWTRTFGGSGVDIGYSVCQTSDDGFIICGSTGSFGAGSDDIWLVRTDTNGDTLWSKTFGGSDSDLGAYVQKTGDGGFMVIGRTSPMERLCLIKTDAMGDTIWTKTCGFSTSLELGHCVQVTSDNGYAITGTLGGAEAKDVYLLRTDSNGDSLWMKRYQSEYTDDMECVDSGNSVRQTTDGGYIIAGKIGDLFVRNVRLIRTDAAGDTLWTKRYDLGDEINVHSVQQTSDGGFVISGENPGVVLIRTDSNGDTLWTKNYGGSSLSHGYDVQQLSDDGFIIAGSIGLGPGENWLFPTRAWLIRTKADGDTLWTKKFGGGSGYDYFRSVLQTSDGGYIITGDTYSFGGAEFDLWLVRLAPESTTKVDMGNLGKLDTIDFLQNYPNPFNSNTRISYTIQNSDMTCLKIYDLLGREVYTLVNEFKEKGSYSVLLDASNLSSGIYFYTLKGGNNFSKTNKMLIIR